VEMSIASENRRLREIVKQLLDRIDENQKVLRHFQTFELKILNSGGVHSLFHLLLDESCRHFRLASTSLLLLDEDGALEKLFGSIQIGNFHNRLQLRQSPDFYQKIYPSDPRVMLQEVDVLTATRLFPGTPKVGSSAFLPLLYQHRVVGSLHFASSEPDRFSATKDANLLEHLAAVVSVCLNHCLEREANDLLQEIDPVLQVGSRRYLESALTRELERTSRSCGYLACVSVEVEVSGDDCNEALAPVAQALRNSVRKVDVCARWHENQLVVLLPESDSRQAQATAGRISKALAEINGLPLSQVQVGVNAWKARKTKNPLTQDKLMEVGHSLIIGALSSGQTPV